MVEERLIDERYLFSPVDKKPIEVGVITEEYPIMIGKKKPPINVPVYDYRAMNYIAELIKSKVVNDFDCPVLITGDRRFGKSSLGLQIAQRINPVKKENIAFRIPQFDSSINDAVYADPDENVFPQTLLDEAGYDMFAQNWMEKVQRNLVKKFEVIGAKKHIFYFILPHRKLLNKGLREGMTNIWLCVDTINDRRGFARFRIGHGNDFELEKYWPVEFCFLFPPAPKNKLWEEYSLKKREFIDEVTGGDDGLEMPPNKLIIQRDILIRELRSKGSTTVEIGRMIGLNDSRISQICSKASP